MTRYYVADMTLFAMPFSLPYKMRHWMALKGQIKVTKFVAGCFS